MFSTSLNKKPAGTKKWGKTMEVYNQKGKRIKLSDRDFLAEGGEGRLYVRKNLVYKIWLNPDHLVPVAKLNELGILDHPSIVRPLEPLFDKNAKSLGYLMNKVPDNAIALPRLFTSSFWQANNISVHSILELVQHMQSVIRFIHKQGFLQVDGNEFNYLVTNQFTWPWFVDVDSYQSPGYPATGIMMSIRDYTQTEFNEGSDWYSFAIVAFQLFTGIHPFKGRHPAFKKGNIEVRVKAGASVLDAGVSYPSSVRDFNLIPRLWFDWFKAMFTQGERVSAPDGKLRIDVQYQTQLIEDGKQVEIKLLASFQQFVLNFWHHNGERIVVTRDKLYVGKTAYTWPSVATSSPGSLTRQDALEKNNVILDAAGQPLFLSIKNGQLVINVPCKSDVQIDATVQSDVGINASKVFVINNIAYVINDEYLQELGVHELAGRKQISVTSARKILPHAITVYSGVIVQNLLGKIYLMIPEAAGRMPQIAVPELDQYKIIDGRYESGVAVFRVADTKGNYQYIRLIFNNALIAYQSQTLADTGDWMNFTVIDKGHQQQVLVSLPADSGIELLNPAEQNRQIRVIEDDKIKTTMRLVNDAGRVAFYADKSIYTMRMK